MSVEIAIVHEDGFKLSIRIRTTFMEMLMLLDYSVELIDDFKTLMTKLCTHDTYSMGIKTIEHYTNISVNDGILTFIRQISSEGAITGTVTIYEGGKGIIQDIIDILTVK